MKTELKLRNHQFLVNQKTVEVWYNGELIGQITGADEPGVRVISKYAIECKEGLWKEPNLVEIRIKKNG